MMSPSCGSAALAQRRLRCRSWKRNPRQRATSLVLARFFFGQSINQLFNPPGIPPNGDSRTPDILVTPNVGVTYSGSTKKQAEHGGFAHDDTNVMILVSNPSIPSNTLTIPVLTAQIAPTILEALGLNPSTLQAVQQQGTQVLPGIFPIKKK